jgi:uncharacterized membrane-anchored protein
MATRHQGQRTVPQAHGGVAKVPAVKPYFWVVKLLTTAMGEAMSDFVVLDVNKYLGVVLGFLVFLAAMWWQLRTPRYGTWPYWTAVSMVAVFGTMAADVMHVVLGLPYLVSAACYAACLVVTFAAWHRSEGTLDVHSIVTRRREVFYWLAVIFTFAMGTALGDLFATTFTLGYLPSAFVFIGLICVPLAAWRLGASPVLTFWAAYILTRPIGASFADFFGMPRDASGMGFGHGPVSLVTLVMVLACFAFMARSGIDQPEVASATANAAGDRRTWQEQPQYAQPQYAQARYGDPGQPRPRYDQPRYDQPRHGGPGPGQPRYDQARPGEPRHSRPGHDRPGEPRHSRPGHDQPRYGDPRRGQPGYDRPPYGEPRYGGPGPGQPGDDRPPYGKPGDARPRYDPAGRGQPRYEDDRYDARRGGPGPDQPRYRGGERPRHARPRPADPRRGDDPRPAGDPRYGPRYGGPPWDGGDRDRRSP